MILYHEERLPLSFQSSIERINVAFCVYSLMEPPEISRILNLQPDSTSRENTTEDRPAFQKNFHGRYYWSIKSEFRVATLEVNDHLDCILDILLSKQAELDALRKEGSTTMDIKIAVWTNEGFSIGAQQCAKIGALGLAIWF